MTGLDDWLLVESKSPNMDPTCSKPLPGFNSLMSKKPTSKCHMNAILQRWGPDLLCAQRELLELEYFSGTVARLAVYRTMHASIIGDARL